VALNVTSLPGANLHNAVAVSTTVLIVGAASGVYAQFGPSMFTISSDFFHDGHVEGNKRRIRNAEILGTAITLAMGWAGSVLTRSMLPFAGAAIYSGISVAGWEYAMAHPARDEGR
jgi:hypothetical protein